MSIQVLDPSYEEGSDAFQTSTRLNTLKGSTIGLISNGKEGTKRFFDALETELVSTYQVEQVVRTTKHNYSAPAEAAILTQAQNWQGVIAGVGD